jgi:hypothetical protein
MDNIEFEHGVVKTSLIVFAPGYNNALFMMLIKVTVAAAQLPLIA